jgi:hypothetical protein
MRPALFALAALLVGSLTLGMTVPTVPLVPTAASHSALQAEGGKPYQR